MTLFSRFLAGFVLWAVVGAVAAGGACRSERDDRFVLLRRAPERAPGAPTPLLYPSPDDAGAARVRRLMSDRFTGELLRTLAMARRLVESTAPIRSVRRARAEAPTYLALGISDRLRERPYRDRVIGEGWRRERLAADLPIVWVDDGDPARTEIGRMLDVAAEAPPGDALRDAVALEQVVSGLGRAILSLVAPPEARGAGGEDVHHPLADGYVKFLDVVNAEWRSGAWDGPLTEARAQLRRAGWFAEVRSNLGVEQRLARGTRCHIEDQPEGMAAWLRGASVGGFGNPCGGRHQGDDEALALVSDPTVIATVLYRLASSPAGRRLAPDETYRALVQEAPPAGVSPGRLLGAFRNFQGKLLVAWNRAVAAGEPPRDLIDLVEIYARTFPDEQAEVARIFLVTTYGLTARPGGVDPSLPPERVESRLAALTADVLFGRSDLRAALRTSVPLPASPFAAPAGTSILF